MTACLLASWQARQLCEAMDQPSVQKDERIGKLTEIRKRMARIKRKPSGKGGWPERIAFKAQLQQVMALMDGASSTRGSATSNADASPGSRFDEESEFGDESVAEVPDVSDTKLPPCPCRARIPVCTLTTRCD
jgi:hypothetical protein